MSILRPLAVAFAFLTRLPVRTRNTDDADAGRSLAFFPVVGLTLGITLATATWLAHALPPTVAAVGLVTLLAAMTGGLHLDGLADVFDALGGGHGDRQRMLAVMRDSRIGAHGALALLLVVLAKVLAASVVLQRGDLWAVVVFPAVARWTVVTLIVAFPYVREVGLGRPFKDGASPGDLAWATLFVAGLLFWVGRRAALPTATAFAAAFGCGLWMQRRLGGLTGDVYGAAIELAEVAFLIGATPGA